MISEDRLTQALHHVANGVTPPGVDLEKVRGSARAKRVRAASAIAVTAAVALIVTITTLLGDRDTSTLMPASTPQPPTVMSPTSPNSYTSSQYGFTIVHPPGWDELPAVRAWSWEIDAADPQSQAQDAFRPPDHMVRVSAWSVPLDTATRRESDADLVAWVEDYCHRSRNSPCTGIADRAVELCPQESACTSGLLVPFKEDVQAFFRGGVYGSDAIVVVAVWRPESAPSMESYGGASNLLERFLVPMGVLPSTAPVPQRD